MSLSSFHVTEYTGFVYVNLSEGEPQNIEALLPDFAKHITTAMPHVSDLKLASHFINHTKSNLKAIVDNYLECYHCHINHVNFSESVNVNNYEQLLFENWSVQFGEAKSSEASYQFDDSIENPCFDGYWI